MKPLGNRSAGGDGASEEQGEGGRRNPKAHERGRMRRRLRRQQRVREALLLDLGALVFELHRQGRREPELLQAKAAELSAVEEEVRSLAGALEVGPEAPALVAPGIAGGCENCGGLLTTDARFCPSCGAAAAPALAAEPPPEVGVPPVLDEAPPQDPQPEDTNDVAEAMAPEEEPVWEPEQEGHAEPEPVPEFEFEPEAAGGEWVGRAQPIERDEPDAEGEPVAEESATPQAEPAEVEEAPPEELEEAPPPEAEEAPPEEVEEAAPGVEEPAPDDEVAPSEPDEAPPESAGTASPPPSQPAPSDSGLLDGIGKAVGEGARRGWAWLDRRRSQG